MKQIIKPWLFAGILFLLSAPAAYSQTVQPAPLQPSPPANQLESRMALVLEFDTMVAEFLDSLFINEKPDPAILEWCEKVELRAVSHPMIQQAYGELYISIKSCLRGQARKARVSLQQALWIMASERTQMIASTQ